MAVAYGDAFSLTEATTVNSVYTAPTGIVNNDVLILMHFEFNGAGDVSSLSPPTPPAGFAAIPGVTNPHQPGNTNYGVWFYYKVASGESGNYTVTHTSCVNRGILARYGGAEPSGPFSPNAVYTQSVLAGTTVTFTGMTTSVSNCLIIGMFYDDNDAGGNLVVPTGGNVTFTERIDNNHGNYLCDGPLAAAGATGTPTWTSNSTTGTPRGGVLASLQPAVAGAAGTVAPKFNPVPFIGST